MRLVKRTAVLSIVVTLCASVVVAQQKPAAAPSATPSATPPIAQPISSPVVPVAADATVPSIAGNWLGQIEASGLKLRLGLKVDQQAEGKLTAKLDSLDQAAYDLPIDNITS